MSQYLNYPHEGKFGEELIELIELQDTPFYLQPANEAGKPSNGFDGCYFYNSGPYFSLDTEGSF